jgi:hypothetical protein
MGSSMHVADPLVRHACSADSTHALLLRACMAPAGEAALHAIPQQLWINHTMVELQHHQLLLRASAMPTYRPTFLARACPSRRQSHCTHCQSKVRLDMLVEHKFSSA